MIRMVLVFIAQRRGNLARHPIRVPYVADSYWAGLVKRFPSCDDVTIFPSLTGMRRLANYRIMSDFPVTFKHRLLLTPRQIA